MLGRSRLILCARPPRTQDSSNLHQIGRCSLGLGHIFMWPGLGRVRTMRAGKDHAALPSGREGKEALQCVQFWIQPGRPNKKSDASRSELDALRSRHDACLA
jgi:hypothetical protein